MNFIDGLNGLFCFTSIFQLISIIFIASIYGDQEIIVTSIILLIPLFIFLIFNFPFGLIFAGDFGAYFYGFSIALISLYLFGKYQDLLSWLAVLILFYPCMELLFSFLRKKLFDKKSVFCPDKRHLHTLVSLYLSKKINSKYANPLATIILSLFWFLPLLISYYFYNNIYMIFLFIFLFIAVYIYFYIFITKKELFY